MLFNKITSLLLCHLHNHPETWYHILTKRIEKVILWTRKLACTSDYRTTVEQYIAIDTHELEDLLENYNVTHNGDIISGEQKRRLLDIATTLMWDKS